MAKKKKLFDGKCSVLNVLKLVEQEGTATDIEEMSHVEEIIGDISQAAKASNTTALVLSAKIDAPLLILEQRFTVPIPMQAWILASYLQKRHGVRKSRMFAAMISDALKDFAESLPELLQVDKAEFQNDLYEYGQALIASEIKARNAEAKKAKGLK